MGRLSPLLSSLLLLSSASVPLAAQLVSPYGAPIAPHGFPAFYSDGTLALEPCLPAATSGFEVDPVTLVQTPFPSGRSTRPDLCIFAPIDPANPASVQLGVGDENFWFSANSIMTMPGGGKALLVMGVEGAFGGVGVAADGQQMAFTRIRIRIDTTTPGTYTVTYPYGSKTFTNVPVGTHAVDYTLDVGNINLLAPALGFGGALPGEIGPFLTWAGYATDPTLQVRALDPVTLQPTGPVLEQYIGNPNIPHAVTGSPTGNNFFRVVGPGVDIQTNLFQVMGKVYVPPPPLEVAHLFPAPPPPNLFAVGPVNRLATVDLAPVVDPVPPVPPRPEGIVTGADIMSYPKGFPTYIQDTVETLDTAVTPPVVVRSPGLPLTYCPPFDPMCISMPIDPLDPNSLALRVGAESFYWSAVADIDDRNRVTDLRVKGLLVMAMEGTFGGAGTPLEKNQILFARLRIRIDTPVAGTYTVTHPYGQEVFPNVPAGNRAINSTVDIMIADPLNPDQSFIGSLYGPIGPKFLTWDTFDIDPLTLAPNDAALMKPSLVPASPVINYVGDPGVRHLVKGSPTGNNFFRIQGPDGIDVRTDLFAVSGKVFDPLTFNLTANPAAPIANPEAVAVNTAANVINVLLNDQATATTPAPAAPALVNVNIVTPPVGGTAVVDAATKSITYRPSAALLASGGVDTFTYNLTALPLTNPPAVSNNAVVTLTVTPVEVIRLLDAALDVRRARLTLTGTSNFPGTILTIFPGTTTTGTPLGTVFVSAAGTWSYRTTTLTNLTSVTVRSSSPAATVVTQPLRRR